MALADEVADAEAKQLAPSTVLILLKIQWAWFQTGNTAKTGSHRPPRPNTCVRTTKQRESYATVAMGTTHIRSVDLKRQHVTFARKKDIVAACRKKNSETHMVNTTHDSAEYCLYNVNDRPTPHQPIKGALYRIWCGVNRLGDSGVKVV